MKPGKRPLLLLSLLFSMVLGTASCSVRSTPSLPNAATPTLPVDVEPLPSLAVAQAATAVISEAGRSNPSLQPSAESRLRFERISVEQGLSQSTVNCILRDSMGFMWFCTEDGLNRYDGYGFKVYRHDPEDPDSLSNDTVLALHEDQSGALWVGTMAGGLDRFDRETGHWRNYRNEPDAPDGFLRNWIVSILSGPDGSLWIGTYGGGLYQFDPQSQRFLRMYAEIDPWIQTVLQDRSGNLWVGTDGQGLNRINPATGHLTHYRHSAQDPNSLSADRVLSIYEDRAGTLWIGTLLGGLNRFEPETERFVRYTPDTNDPYSLSYDTIWSIHQDRSGVLWLGTGGGGLDRLEGSTGRFFHYVQDPKDSSSLSSNTIPSIYADPTGALWIGTMGGGINRLDGAIEPFQHYRNDPHDANSLSNNIVRAIWQDQAGTLWIGTDDGLNQFDRAAGEWRRYQADPTDPHSLSSNAIRAIYEDRSGVLWVGVFGGGLNRFDRQSKEFTHFLGQDNVVAIYEDRDNVLWLATQGQGLYEFHPGPGTLHRYNQQDGLSIDFVRTVYQDRSGLFWIGTDDGLDRFDRDTEQWRHYEHDPTDPQSLGRGWVGSIHQDRSGTLWIGTAGGGLNRFDAAEDTFTRYTRQDGLPNNEVYGILEEATTVDGPQAGLWLSTNNGLSRFDPDTEAFETYGAGGGLEINKFMAGAHHKSRSGELFFGGVNGFVAFDPQEIEANNYSPPIVLTSLTQDGVEVDAGKATEHLTEATFRWPENSFEFEFAALNYTYPGRNQHAYMLEGFDEDWIYLGTQRSGRYTNLPGGSYTLRLRGSNNDGVWNREGTAIEITVIPPLWQRWWFWGVAGLLLAAGASGAYLLRVSSMERQSRQLEHEVEQRTAELSNTNKLLEQEITDRMRAEEALARRAAEDAVVAERNRLARELHDAVTQTLFSASLIAETLPRSWERDPEKGRRLLKDLHQLSRGALAEMRTLLLELRPAVLVEAKLGDLLRQLAEAATGQSGLPVTVAIDGECALPPDVHIALYRIAQEALNNAVKHARATEVTVRLHCAPTPSTGAGEKEPGTVEMRVQDDGRGFDANTIPSDGLGLDIMRERALSVGAVLTIDSLPDQGTRVRVIWPDRGWSQSEE